MRLNIIIAVALGLLGYGLTVYLDQAAQPPRVVAQVPPVTQKAESGQLVPPFSFTDINGKAHDIESFKGKVILLNFWASWCAPCIKEFPDLLTIAKTHEKDVVLIALSSDHDQKAMDRFLTKMQKKYVINTNVFIARDENTRITHDIFGTFRLPETIIIDRNLKLRHKFVGARWTIKEFEERLKDFL